MRLKESHCESLVHWKIVPSALEVGKAGQGFSVETTLALIPSSLSSSISPLPSPSPSVTVFQKDAIWTISLQMIWPSENGEEKSCLCFFRLPNPGTN
jgi:hypothetical protein